MIRPLSEPGRPESGPRKAWNVLFIDDDRDFLDAQALFFGSRGHRVQTAESSQEALALLDSLGEGRGDRLDIIFLDLMLEHTDSGFRLAHAIRRRQELAGVPIVMLSGVARETGHRFDQEGRKLLTWSRLDRFLDKPVTGRQLLAVAEELLSRTGPRFADGEDG